jgi:predicted PolB exonuclease-like 3'-5' exonuclease
MITTTLDIETISDWKPPEDKPDAFPPTGTIKPVVISWLVVDTATRLFMLRSDAIEAHNVERNTLNDLGKDLRRSHRIVSWNGRNFDMPILGNRAMARGVLWGFWHEMRHRYENYRKALNHYDLMDQLGDQGGSRGMRLDHVCVANGLPGKGDVDGSKVGELWAAPGGKSKVVRYCAEDVLQTWLIYLRYLFSFKEAEQVKAFWALSVKWARAHDLLKEFAEKIPEEYPT